MTEEEKETISILEDLAEHGLCYTVTEDIQGKLKIILNLIQKQQKEIEKLRNKNKDLLRKLRNRVKEVKKLIKYSAYKKEFSKLNTIIEQKNKMINYMANFINDNTPYTRHTKELENEQGIRTAKFTEQYFEEQAKEVEK